MGSYLGIITIRNHHVNFKPLFKYENDEITPLSAYEKQALLPESSYGDINFYSDDYRMHVDLLFTDDTYCLLDFEADELEPNIIGGVRNPTGYKIEVSQVLSGKFRSLSDINRYYVLDDAFIEGSYKTNPILVVTDPYVYENLEVVIPVKEEKNTVIGPFKVSLRELDGKWIIKTGLQSDKFILRGYRLPTYLSEYTFTIRGYSEERKFIHIDEKLSKAVNIDVISKEQLLTAFRSTLHEDSFIDGKIDLKNVADLVSSHADSLFVGDNIPTEIQESRFDIINTLLTDEERLNDTFGFISITITGLLDKYQESEQYQKMVQELADNPEFMSRIQRYQIITDRIEGKQAEFDELTKRAEALQEQIETEKKNEYAADLLGEYDIQIQDLEKQKDKLNQEISNLHDQLGMAENVAGEQKKLAELEEQVHYKAMRERELDDNIKALASKLDSIFSNSSEKAMSFAFDGMLANRMLQQAAEWENQQAGSNYSGKLRDIRQMTIATPNAEELVNTLVERIQKYRPTYDKNTILNILICYTQGFLTVFSGEPGTGKTSICKILANALGLNAPSHFIRKYDDGFCADRFISISVERGWTTKRDLIGYYNPLSKTFDRSNRKIFDALNVLDLEARGESTDTPFMILLDEANLSPMEYYWADFMNVCDGIDCTSTINLGDNFNFNIPDELRFVATINNDHTTESLSPRLVDRAWIIRLPKVKSGTARPVCFNSVQDEMIGWSAMVSAFGVDSESMVQLTGIAKEIYDELLNKCRIAKISVSARADNAIRSYWAIAQRLFENDTNYGTDASIVALDYAVAQRILPHIDGSGEKYGTQLRELQKFCSGKNLFISAELLSDIIRNGDDSMQYYQFFA